MALDDPLFVMSRREMMPTERAKALAGPLTTPAGCNANATAASVAPMDWPVRRAVPIMPLAAPARELGELITMVWLFGDWKSPKPSPQRASGSAIELPGV